MTFAGSAQVHKSLPAWHRLAQVGGAVAAAAVLLSACGGGDQVKKFKPAKIVSFGDQNSALVSEEVTLSGGGTATVHGLKYGVNAVSVYQNITSSLLGGQERTTALSGDTILPNSAQTTWAAYPVLSTDYSASGVTAVEVLYGSDVVVVQYQDLITQVTNGTTTSSEPVDINYRYNYSCVDNRLWIQVVANNYGLGYKTQCPMETRAGGTTYAENGATVAAVAAQVSAHRGELGSDTLVTVMAGQNDILNAYAQVKAGTLTLDAAKSSMTAQGGALSAVVNDIIKTGARVLLVRLPDLGLSPLAKSDGSTGVARLTAMTLAFNNGILNKLTNDGHKIALYNFYDSTHYMQAAADKNDGRTYEGVGNMSTPLCADTVIKPDATKLSGASVAPLYGGDGLLYCSNQTLNGGVSISTYFWADKVHMGPAGHATLGTRAYELADNNTL